MKQSVKVKEIANSAQKKVISCAHFAYILKFVYRDNKKRE